MLKVKNNVLKPVILFIQTWHTELFFFVISFLLFFWFLHNMPIFDSDTFYYIAKARKMLVTGDWLNISAVMAKPVFGIWCMAFTYKFFGVSLASTYFWHSLFSLATLVVVYLFVFKAAGKQVARLATGILLTSIMFFYQSCSPMLDLPMIFFLTLAHFLLFNYITTKKIKISISNCNMLWIKFSDQGSFRSVFTSNCFCFVSD
ncbi:glycosyltransferase family 39 protein [bacterium]|nr:glycosyltransferase family 39 protein [bacterium]